MGSLSGLTLVCGFLWWCLNVINKTVGKYQNSVISLCRGAAFESQPLFIQVGSAWNKQRSNSIATSGNA